MSHVLDVLKERGFLEQCTDEKELIAVLREPQTCYIGFDPTASSFHAGSLVPIMALAHMQRHGHRPIALMGGGTALIGDPSGKTEMRKMLTREEIEGNSIHLKEQLSRFLDFENGRALLLNNADWLVDLNYIEFLRDIGRHFSVNRMLATESVKLRLEKGLSFLEFNYQLLQAYDFYYLYKEKNCILQMGGNDQWGNIVAGIDLIRRKLGGKAYGITFPLLTTATGNKMGKTAEGALWLSPELTSPYEYYQYWINVHDDDVIKFLKLFTFLPMEKIEELSHLKGEELREAKEILAFEVTKLTHGIDAAREAKETSIRLFGKKKDGEEAPLSAPTIEVKKEEIESGIPAYELFYRSGLSKSKSEARRLISQGGAYINGKRVSSFDMPITIEYFPKGTLLLRAGRKRYCQVSLKE